MFQLEINKWNISEIDETNVDLVFVSITAQILVLSLANLYRQ